MYPAGRSGPWRGEIPEADCHGLEAPVTGLRRRCSGDGAGFEPEDGHLVLLVADAQREVVQGASKDGVGAVVEWLKQRYVALPPYEHHQCAGQVVRQLQQRWCCV